MSPEEKSRLEIDRKLETAGYILQDMKEFDPMRFTCEATNM